MRRRDFIAWLGGAASAWTGADSFAAQKSPMGRIATLSIIPLLPKECCASGECRSLRCEAYQTPACWLMVDLHALGWDEGENLHIEVLHANGDPMRLPRLAAERPRSRHFFRLKNSVPFLTELPVGISLKPFSGAVVLSAGSAQ